MTNFENQCCTQEQAIALHKAGILQHSLFYYSNKLSAGQEMLFCRRERNNMYYDHKGLFAVLAFPDTINQTYSAFNAAELGAMLLKHTEGCHFHNLS